MDSFSRIDSCRICGNRDLAPILSLGDQFLTGVFPRTKDEPLTKGPLELVRCHGGDDACGLVQLRHSYSSTEMYGDNYGYRSSLNRSMLDHLERKAASLQDAVQLENGDIVIDIGSNDGSLLSFFPERSVRIGIDPTAAKFRDFYAPGIHVIADFFSARVFESRFGLKKARIVTSVAMFYDLEQPLAFAREIASILDDDGVWHFEQSYMPLMLATNGYDTICHEHVEYYALRQIAWILERAGMRVLRVELNDVNGGSFGVTACRIESPRQGDEADVHRILESEREQGFGSMDPFERFAGRVIEHRASLVAMLEKLKGQGSRVLGYGASTKGNVLLQYCGIGPDLLPYIAEVNPEKFGAFTPGTSIPIVSEAEARAMKPDYFLAMPWHFRRSIIEREQPFLQAGGAMIFPLPSIEIVRGA